MDGTVDGTVVFVVWSVSGLACSTYTMIEYPFLPGDKSVRNRIVFWFFQVLYLYSFVGVLFQAVLFILTILLTCAIVKGKPRCIMPWIVWMIIMLCGVLFQTFWALNADRDTGIFVACASLPFCAVMIYFVLVIITFYQFLMQVRVSQRHEGPQEGIECASEADENEIPSNSQPRIQSPVSSESPEIISEERSPEPESEANNIPKAALSVPSISPSVSRNIQGRRSSSGGSTSSVVEAPRHLQKLKAKSKRNFFQVYAHDALFLYY